MKLYNNTNLSKHLQCSLYGSNCYDVNPLQRNLRIFLGPFSIKSCYFISVRPSYPHNGCSFILVRWLLYAEITTWFSYQYHKIMLTHLGLAPFSRYEFSLVCITRKMGAVFMMHKCATRPRWVDIIKASYISIYIYIYIYMIKAMYIYNHTYICTLGHDSCVVMSCQNFVVTWRLERNYNKQILHIIWFIFETGLVKWAQRVF